jgi:hypothetical protein
MQPWSSDTDSKNAQPVSNFCITASLNFQAALAKAALRSQRSKKRAIRADYSGLEPRGYLTNACRRINVEGAAVRRQLRKSIRATA